MIEKTTCTYCGWKFPTDFPQNISDNSDSLFCENCGTEIINSNVSQIEAKPETNTKKKNNEKSKFSRIYEKLRPEKDPIDRILDDSDFPLIFKENFNLVICRIIFDSLRDLVDISQLKANKIELSEALISDIEYNLEPVMNSRINDAFLTNLYKIPRKAFENHLKRFQSKLESSRNFQRDFKIFSRWLINMVYELVSYFDDPDNLPKFEQTILKDLRSFNIVLHDTLNSSEEEINYYDDKEQKVNKGNLNSIQLQQIKNIKEAALYLRTIIIPDLIHQKLTVQGYSPGIRVLRDNGHRDFEKRVKRLNLNYDEIIRKAKLKKKVTRKGKWAFINYDLHTGEELTKAQKLERSDNFYQNILIPNLIKNNITKEGKTPTEKDLIKGGFISFVKSLGKGKFKIKYNEFLKEVNLKLNRDSSKWEFLDYDENGNLHTIAQLRIVIGDHFKNTIFPSLIKRGIIRSNDELSSKLKDKEFQNFIQAARIRDVNYNDILKVAGFTVKRELNRRTYKPRITRLEWYDLDYDNDGNQLNYEGKIKVAASFLLDKIIPDLFSLKIIKIGETPLSTLIRHNNFENFYQSLRRRKIDYDDVLLVAGYEPHKSKWNFLIKDVNGKLLDKQEKIHQAALYLISTIIPDLMRQDLLKKDQKPSKSLILEGGHRDFLSVIRRDINDLDYIEILEYASKSFGIELNPASSKWSFLDYDENHKKLDNAHIINKAMGYFKSIIIPDLIRKGFSIKDHAPPASNLAEYGHGGFISAICRRGIYYNEVVKAAGYRPSEYSKLFNIGNLTHKILEWLFLLNTKNKGLDSYYEARTSYFSLDFSLNRADNTLFVETVKDRVGLSKIMKSFLSSHNEIKLINIDYFIGSSMLTVKKKAQKQYQGRNKLLIILPLWSKKSSETYSLIDKNVIAMTPSEFINFIGYKGKLLDIFKKTIKLSKLAIYSEKHLKMLENLADKAKKGIEQFADCSTIKLLEDLNKKGMIDLLN